MNLLSGFCSLFPVHERDIASLHQLCNRGMALIKDAFLKSPVKRHVCCLYQCFVSLVELHPALGKVHAKSITQFLSAILLKEQPAACSCRALNAFLF